MTIFINPTIANLQFAHDKAVELFGDDTNPITAGAFIIRTSNQDKVEEYSEYLTYHLKEEFTVL